MSQPRIDLPLPELTPEGNQALLAIAWQEGYDAATGYSDAWDTNDGDELPEVPTNPYEEQGGTP